VLYRVRAWLGYLGSHPFLLLPVACVFECVGVCVWVCMLVWVYPSSISASLFWAADGMVLSGSYCPDIGLHDGPKYKIDSGMECRC